MSVRTCAVGGSVRSTGAARRRRRVKVKRRGSIVVASSNGLAEPIDEETHLQDRARRARVARRHRHERLQRRLLLFGTHPDRGGAPIRARRTTVHLRSGARDFLRAPTRPRDHRTKSSSSIFACPAPRRGGELRSVCKRPPGRSPDPRPRILDRAGPPRRVREVYRAFRASATPRASPERRAWRDQHGGRRCAPPTRFFRSRCRPLDRNPSPPPSPPHLRMDRRR